MRLRFAPAPSNNLHIGNIKALVLNWTYAQKHNGKLLLRIDDTQLNENTEDNIQSIKNILSWLNIKPDKTIRQSERNLIYKQYFQLLKENGYIYPCYETLDEIRQSSNRIYKKSNKNIESNIIPTYYRFELNKKSNSFKDGIQGSIEVDIKNLNDPIIYTKNKFMYLFTSSVDDVDENITHIIRGSDHITNTFIQQQIMQAILASLNKKSDSIPSQKDLPCFNHYGLFLSSDTGEKLSKRKNNFNLNSIINDILPISLIKYLIASGVSKNININEHHSIKELINLFSIENLSKKNIIYDIGMLFTINKIYLYNLDFEQVNQINSEISLNEWNLIRENISKIEDIHHWHSILFNFQKDKHVEEQLKTQYSNILPLVLEIIENTQKEIGVNTSANEHNNEIFNILKDKLKGKFFKPLRLCLTNLSDGPKLINLFNFFSLKEILLRIKYYL